MFFASIRMNGWYSFLQEDQYDLQRELPDVRSFSVTNLKYMTYFYELYADVVNRPQLEDDSNNTNRPQVGDDFTEAIFLIPWGHNKLIIDKCKGFAFVGREYRLVVGKTEQFIDMLFYNIPNHCYVVVEVKVRDFEPGDMGQLGTYIGAVDGILKGEGDNQTVGLLICRTKDNVLAQYAVNMINAPIGISEYELTNVMPEEFKSSMPTIEEIENELKNR